MSHDLTTASVTVIIDGKSLSVALDADGVVKITGELIASRIVIIDPDGPVLMARPLDTGAMLIEPRTVDEDPPYLKCPESKPDPDQMTLYVVKETSPDGETDHNVWPHRPPDDKWWSHDGAYCNELVGSVAFTEGQWANPEDAPK